MGRKTIEVDKVLVEKIMTELESKNTYQNRSKLFEDTITELVTKHNYKSFSTTLLYQRTKLWNTQFKTPVGKRGQHFKDSGGNTEALKAFREGAEPTSKRVDSTTKLIAHYTTEEKGRYLKLAKSIKRGSLKAAIKLKCLDCSNFQKDEIKHCQCFDCPLWPVRPYRIQQIETKIPLSEDT